jgi:hypothetical protein
MRQLFEQVRAPSTLGMLLRCFTFGHVRALDGIAARLLARLTGATPILGGADQLVLLDLDDTVRATYGHTKQGAGRGYSGVNGLNALLATLTTPVSAPVIAGARLRRGRRTPRAGRSSYSPTPWPPPAAAVDGGWWWCAPMRRSTTVRSSRPAGGPGHGSP